MPHGNHLMRYIYFCFDVILYYLIRSYDLGVKTDIIFQYRCLMYHLTSYISYIAVLFSYLCDNVFV
jgi:hypothetical protein